MIKKLVLAAAFAASVTVGVQPASASPMLCMQKLESDLVACGENNPNCTNAAEAAFVECLQRQYPEKPPIEN